MGPLAGRAGSGALAAQREAASRDLGEPDNRQQCRQAKDRSNGTTQHDLLHPIRTSHIAAQPTRKGDKGV
jgi:hypothetical protein